MTNLTIPTLLNIHNPVILSAGILGDSVSKLKSAHDAGAGAVVTKSITLKARPNRPEPTVIKLKNGGWLNAVGLANPGAEKFSQELESVDFPIIVSLAGSSPSEFKQMIELFDFNSIRAFELNLSCPNVHDIGTEIGDNSKLVSDIVNIAKSATNKPVFVKIGHHMLESVKHAIQSGVDGITAINTIPATSLNKDGKPVFGSNIGGLSGPTIKPIALRTIHDISTKYDIPIMGCGGISNWQDAVEFIMVGATAVHIGSAVMFGSVNILGEIADDIQNWQKSNISK